MNHDWRKFRVGFIAVVTVLAVYLLYNQAFKTPRIKVNKSPGPVAVDVNQAYLNQETTKVGQVSIGTLEMARFSTLNPKTKRLEREFGFEKLLHEEGDQWEIEQPYMNIFRPELTCYITAEKGFVLLESDVSPPNPTDAILTGNVVAHIVPTGTDVKESFIYLDDLTFVSATSRFSTLGPVTFISEDAQMQGIGLEMIYDEQNKRLAFLRIDKLEHLQFKVEREYSLAQADSESTDSTAASTAADSNKPRNAESYVCVFSKNVVIDTGRQFIAADQIRISDIFWSSSKSDDGSEQKPVETGPQRPAQTSVSLPPINTADLIHVAVSCDNGIVVVPTDSLDTLKKIKDFLPRPGSYSAMEVAQQQQGITTLGAERIDYSVATSDAMAIGTSKLTFYIRDMMEQADTQTIIPVTITADRLAKFSPKSNQITFEGNCICRMFRGDQDMVQQYSLSAPKLIIDLEDEQVSSGRAMANVRKITAISDTGANAKLSSVKRLDDELAGGIELKCPRFEFDVREQMFVATGPGIIKVDNSNVPQPPKGAGRFSLQKPCYALVRNFEQLRYYLKTEKIVADNAQGRIYIDYFPITDGQPEQVTVTAGHIEVDLVETAAGRYRLWTLLAKDGISFQDRDKLFEGSELLYDDQRDLVWAKGSDAMPAYFNGIVFDGIEYNLATEEVKKVEIRGPGFFRIGR